MKVKPYAKLCEIQTKVASVLPFLVALVFAQYRYNIIKPIETIVFFVSVICIDLATTAINNYMDYKRAIVKEGYNYEKHNAIVYFQLSEKKVIATIIILLVLGASSGIYLVTLTDFVVLIFGAIAFFVGIFYSFGPIPISRTPFGEIFSGLLMGGLIFFVAVYIQVFEQGLILLFFKQGYLHIDLQIIEIIKLVIVSLPMIFGISNIMLANNICDMEEDVVNKRYTLPYFLGRKYSLYLFHFLTYSGIAAIITGVVIGVLPITSLLCLLLVIPLFMSSRVFHKKQVKSETFVVAIKQFVMTTSVYAFTILLGLIIGYIVNG